MNGLYVADAINQAFTNILPILTLNPFSAYKIKDIEKITYKDKPIDFFEQKEDTSYEKTEIEKEKEYRDILNHWI